MLNVKRSSKSRTWIYLYIKIGLSTTRHVCCYSCKLGLWAGRTDASRSVSYAHEGLRARRRASQHGAGGLYTVFQKNCAKLFFVRTVKFRPIVKIFGTKIAKRTSFSEVYSFSTSPNLSMHYHVKRRCAKLLHNAVIIIVCSKLYNYLISIQ